MTLSIKFRFGDLENLRKNIKIFFFIIKFDDETNVVDLLANTAKIILDVGLFRDSPGLPDISKAHNEF